MGFSHGFFATLGSHGLGVWAFCDLRRKAEFCETHVQKTSQLVLVSRLIEGCCDMRFPAKRDDTTKVVPSSNHCTALNFRFRSSVLHNS